MTETQTNVGGRPRALTADVLLTKLNRLHANGARDVFASNAYWAKEFGCSESTITRRLTELVKAKRLRRAVTRYSKDGRVRSLRVLVPVQPGQERTFGDAIQGYDPRPYANAKHAAYMKKKAAEGQAKGEEKAKERDQLWLSNFHWQLQQKKRKTDVFEAPPSPPPPPPPKDETYEERSARATREHLESLDKMWAEEDAAEAAAKAEKRQREELLQQESCRLAVTPEQMAWERHMAKSAARRKAAELEAAEKAKKKPAWVPIRDERVQRAFTCWDRNIEPPDNSKYLFDFTRFKDFSF